MEAASENEPSKESLNKEQEAAEDLDAMNEQEKADGCRYWC